MTSPEIRQRCMRVPSGSQPAAGENLKVFALTFVFYMWRATQKKVNLTRKSRFDLHGMDESSLNFLSVIFGIFGKFSIDIGENYFRKYFFENIFSRSKIFAKKIKNILVVQIFNEHFWKVPKNFKILKNFRKFSIFETKFWKFWENFPKNENFFSKHLNFFFDFWDNI